VKPSNCNLGPSFDLRGLVELIRELGHTHIRVIEVGSWRGLSASVIADAIKQFPNGILYCVDHWEGSPSTRQPWEIEKTKENIYETFLRNMFILGHFNRVMPIKLDSQRAAAFFPDSFADIIFIDGDHVYEQVKADIGSWWPKVKDGGVLCGHDMENHYSRLPEKLRKDPTHLEKDSVQGLHIGVIKAVCDSFGEESVQLLGGTIWSVRKDNRIM